MKSITGRYGKWGPKLPTFGKIRKNNIFCSVFMKVSILRPV